jgi:hypothetical protein
MFIHNFLNLQMLDYMRALKTSSAYGNLVQIINIGSTHERRPLTVVKVRVFGEIS